MKRAIRNVGGFLGCALLFLAVVACFSVVVVPPFLDRIYYQGPRSDHFDGERFFNHAGADTGLPPGGGSRGNFVLRQIFGDDRPPWPETVPVTPSKPAARVDGGRMVATWVGHATWLVQADGVNILTDPIYAEKAGPFGLGPQRVARPGIAFDDLPKIDLIVVSHNHYDHMDLGTLQRLWERDKPVIVTSLGNDTLIGRNGAKVTAIDWGGRVSVRPGVEVVVNRNHHWGSRWFRDRNRALWSSFVVRLPSGNLFFAGDTGFGDGEWPREAATYGPIRLALIPIGAFRFRPGQMDTASHIGPIQATEVFARSGATRGLAMHWGTFHLSQEAYDTPPRLLGAVNACRGVTGFDAVPVGRAVEVEAVAAQRPVRALDAKCLDTPAVRGLR